MRSWYPIEPKYLDRKRLLGEHVELHAMFNINTGTSKKGGYRNHPEVLRWKNYLPALKKRHDEIVLEMITRGYKHHSPINDSLIDSRSADTFPNTIEPLENMWKKLHDKQKT